MFEWLLYARHHAKCLISIILYLINPKGNKMLQLSLFYEQGNWGGSNVGWANYAK